ncbi:MAG: tagaturonate reductase [Ruminococcaceae bacterium]|nr:tagaturonate reductase [Oscillospiraceae bacterium]
MKERVIQFGEGGFLRGFADWMLQIANEKNVFDGKVVVVQPIEKGMCDMLTAQGCVYTHLCRGAEGVDVKRIDVISRCVKPYDDFDGYIALAQNTDFRFIISNTTEAGIAFVDTDKITDRPASSFPGKLTQLLKARFDAGLDGFVFLPCELIDKNGENLKKCVLQYADLWELGETFKSWIENENIFCNTLVDRINTGYPKEEKIEVGFDDKMINTSEYFHLWVIEGYKGLFEEIPFDKCGLNVILTDNLEMYRTRKVRILNGAHTSFVPYALLSGFDTVKSCIDDENMLSYIKKCVYEEIIPTLDLPRDELIEYANNVITRFSNPYIRHMLISIALNSVSKFKVRVLPSILEYIKRFDKMPNTLLFSFAKLIDFYMTDMTNDDPSVTAFMKSATVGEILANEKLWGEDLSFLEKEVAKYVVNK